MFNDDDNTSQNQGDEFNEASASSSGAAVPPTAQPSPAAGSTAAAPVAGASAQAPAQSSDDHSEGRDLGEGESASQPTTGQQDTTRIKGNSFGNRMLHGILNALGGSEDTLMQRDPESGKMIVTHVKSGPGSQWKRIIAGALTGAAAGAAAPPGPGHLGRAAGAGFGAAAQQAEGIQDAKRKNANEDFDVQQKASVTKAQHALLTQQIATSAWEMKRSKIQYSMDASKQFNETQQLIGSDPTHEDLGLYPSFADFVAKNNGKDTAKGMTDRLLQAVPELDAEGNVIGVHGYKMTPGWGSKRNTEPVKIDMGGVVNGQWKEQWQTIPALGKTNDEIMQLQNAQTAAKSKFETEKFKESQQNKRTDTQAGAEVASANIHAKAQTDAATIAAGSRENVAKIRAAGVGQTLTSNTRTMMETAPKVIALIDKLDGLVAKNSDEIGPEAGRFNEIVTGKGGLENQEYTKIRTDAGLLSTLVMKMHLGARGGSQSIAYFKDLLANAAQSPENYRAALKEVRDYAQMVAGTKEGENVVVGKEQPPPPPAGASDEVYKDGALIGHVVNNKFVPLEKQK